MLSEYDGHLMLLGEFPDKVTPDINCIEEAIAQCYVLVAKVLL